MDTKCTPNAAAAGQVGPDAGLACLMNTLHFATLQAGPARIEELVPFDAQRAHERYAASARWSMFARLPGIRRSYSRRPLAPAVPKSMSGPSAIAGTIGAGEVDLNYLWRPQMLGRARLRTRAPSIAIRAPSVR